MESNELFSGDMGAAGYASGMAELAISQIYVQPQTINANDGIILGVEARNEGTAATGPFYARFSLDNGEIVDMEMPSIEPGTSTFRDWEHAPMEPGNHVFYVSLDPDHRVPEMDPYGNNSGHQNFVVNAAVVPDTSVKETTDEQGNQVKEISFEDEPITIEVPVSHVGKGRTATGMVDQLLDDLSKWVIAYWSNYSDGLTNFTNRMSFSSEQEAEPKYLEATFKAFAKQALDFGLEQLGEHLGGPWGKIIGNLKRAAENFAGMSEASDAAANAEGEVRIVSYVEALRNGIGNKRDQMLKDIESEHVPLADYIEDKIEQGMGRSEQGNITGDAARLVNELHERVAAFQNAIPSAAQFQEKITEAFADTPVMTDYISHGGVEAGNLRIHVEVTVKDNQWVVDSVDDAWTLLTTAPKPERLAGGLQSSLQNQGKKPWQAKMEKLVQIRIGYDDGYIVFTDDPLNYEPRANVDTGPFERAWNTPQVREKVLNVAKLKGAKEW